MVNLIAEKDYFNIGVYKITNLINNKVYIGSTTSSFKERFRQHRKYLRGNYHHSNKLQNAWNKYGSENFIFEVVEVTDKSTARTREGYWIQYFDSFKNGYNVTLSVNGGVLGTKLTLEHKQRISKANIGNKNRLNLLHDQQTKESISMSVIRFNSSNSEAALKAKNNRRNKIIELNKTMFNILKKKPVLQIDVQTNKIIKEWTSSKDAGENLSIYPTSITKVCKGKGKTAGGFKWSYK